MREMRVMLSRVVMLSVVMALVLSLLAALAPTVSAQGGTIIPGGPTGGLNKWVRHDLPTTQHWQMAPNTDIWDLTAADDGTLFALVEDTSGADDMIMTDDTVWDGLRWAVYPAYSDVALFKSTDGGYTWTLAWHIPASENGAPIAVVPQPGYVDGDSANDAVFIATGSRFNEVTGNWIDSSVLNNRGGDVYVSSDGGSNFTRVTPRCPAVTLTQRGIITSMDVAENMNNPGTFVVVVGTHGRGQTPRGEGVWTWNEDGDRDWRDKQVSNAMPPAPFPGTMPAGNELHATQVKFSPNYTEDGQIIAVVRDGSGGDPAGQPQGMYVCFYDEFDGTWGGDPDSPTNVKIGPGNQNSRIASIAMGDDYSKSGENAYVFVGLSGQGVVVRDVWRIRALPIVTGPSTATAMGLGVGQGGPARFINDIIVQGAAGTGAVYVACEFPANQAQVYRGTQATLWPSWTPSFKPPSGRWPVFVTDMNGTLMAAGGSDIITTGGVHRCAAGCEACAGGQRMVFNGVGLMDDIAVSEDIPGYVNANQALMLGTSWCLAEATAEEVSPMYETDNLIYVATFSEWYLRDRMDDAYFATGMSLWRWTDGIHWERIMLERLVLPSSSIPGGTNDQFIGMPTRTSIAVNIFVNMWTWWPRVPRGFSDDPYVFLLGGIQDTVQGPWGDMLWHSPDLGDTWIPSDQMPLGAVQNGGAGLSESGWWVENNNLVFLGDIAGWVYKTTDRGASWSEGALTAAGLEVDSIITSPVYSETGNSDKCVLVGTFDPIVDGQNEVWLSQDGCEQDLENVGAEAGGHPGWGMFLRGETVVNFDNEWETNRMVYSATSNWLDRWELVGPGATELTRIDFSDVGVYRAEVNLNDPSASTWEHIWNADDFHAVIEKEPQPYPGMTIGMWVYRMAYITDVQVGEDGTLYIPFAVRCYGYNMFPPKPPSPRDPGAPGRLTLGGVLRSVEPTQAVIEWDVIDQGLGEWDGLFLNRAPVGNSNTLISLAWDWQEWRFKLAILDDTLCTKSDPSEPLAGDTGVGDIIGDKVSVALGWADLDADVYQWQVDDDCGFVAPVIASDTTSDPAITVTGLEPGVSYCWRVRALEPALSRWSDAQSFTTIAIAEHNAPQLVSPKAGADIAEKRPVFQWSAVGWADQYQIQVASDPGFGSSAILIDETLGNTQAYQSTVDLANDTYYWRVKASSDTQDVWSSTGVFTVGGEAVGGGTAAWVWVLIVLGVLLLLLLLWLIARTRAAA